MTSIIYPHAATIFAATCACIFVVIGVIGNLVTIIALRKCPKLQTQATTAFILSLCTSDLFFASVCLPLTAIRYINEAWTLGDTLCQIFPVIFYGNMAVSLLSMVCITLNRFVLITFRSYYNTLYKPLSIYIQLFCVWSISFLIMLPPLLGVWGSLGLDETTFSCTVLKKDGRSIKKILFLIGFVLPCLVIIVSYTSIYCTVQRQRQKIRAHCANLKGLNNGMTNNEMRMTFTMLITFLCFLGCFLPLMLVNVADEETKYPWLHIIGSVLAWASSIINPFIYAVRNRTYRVAYFNLYAAIKFWGRPISPMDSKTPSRMPREGSDGHTNSNVLCKDESHSKPNLLVIKEVV